MRKGVIIGDSVGVDENLFERDLFWIYGIEGVEPTIRSILLESELEEIFKDDGYIPSNGIDGVDESFPRGGLYESG